MPTFEYQAVNSSGERVSGTVLGGTMEAALSALAQGGLMVQRINESALLEDTGPVSAVANLDPPPVVAEPVPMQPIPPQPQYSQQERPPSQGEGPPVEQRNYIARNVVGPLVGMVPLKNLSFFYRQFSTMLDAGVPIVQALETLGRQGSSPKFHSVIAEIRGHVEVGRPISAGMQRYPEVFPALAVSMVRAGEEGGFLAHSFTLLANYTESELELRNLIKRTTFYPKLVLFLTIPIVLGVNFVIGYMGKEGGLSSPLTSPIVWMFLGPLLVAAFLYFRIGLANPRIRYGWDAFVLKVPYVGETMKQLCMAKFGRALGALYKGGVPINKALVLSGDACGNEYLRSKIVPAGRRLETGEGIGQTLADTQAFSPIVLDMVFTGERTGNLDSMLNRMADFYEDEGKVRSKQLGQVLGVVVLIIAALCVFYIVYQFISQYAAQVQDIAKPGAGE